MQASQLSRDTSSSMPATPSPLQSAMQSISTSTTAITPHYISHPSPPVIPTKNIATLTKPKETINAITIDKLRSYFHHPLNVVAATLGISLTYLKTICRKNNIHKWPYRKIQSLGSQVAALESALRTNDASHLVGNNATAGAYCMTEEERSKLLKQVNVYKANIAEIIANPNLSSATSLEVTIQKLSQQMSNNSSSSARTGGLSDQSFLASGASSDSTAYCPTSSDTSSSSSSSSSSLYYYSTSSTIPAASSSSARSYAVPVPHNSFGSSFSKMTGIATSTDCEDHIFAGGSGDDLADELESTFPAFDNWNPGVDLDQFDSGNQSGAATDPTDVYGNNNLGSASQSNGDFVSTTHADLTKKRSFDSVEDVSGAALPQYNKFPVDQPQNLSNHASGANTTRANRSGKLGLTKVGTQVWTPVLSNHALSSSNVGHVSYFSTQQKSGYNSKYASNSGSNSNNSINSSNNNSSNNTSSSSNGSSNNSNVPKSVSIFVPPVELAPLVQLHSIGEQGDEADGTANGKRKRRYVIPKDVKPMIEPDICNLADVSFLPMSFFRPDHCIINAYFPAQVDVSLVPSATNLEQQQHMLSLTQLQQQQAQSLPQQQQLCDALGAVDGSL